MQVENNAKLYLSIVETQSIFAILNGKDTQFSTFTDIIFVKATFRTIFIEAIPMFSYEATRSQGLIRQPQQLG